MQQIHGRTYRTVKRGHGAAIHLTDVNGNLTLCSGYFAGVSREVAKDATCKTCIRVADMWRPSDPQR